MFAFKKLIGDVELNKDLILILLIGGLYSLSIALSNTFVNVYLWKQSGKFVDIGLYNLAIAIMQPITFIIAGKIAKKIDRVIVMRLGVISLAIFFVTVLLIGDNAGDFILLLGGILGTGYGFYWLAFNVLTFEITEPETRDFFNGFMGILGSSAGMIGPFLAGFIISTMEKLTGYKVIFAISLALFTGAVVLSFFLKRRAAKGEFLFIRIFKERRNNQNWRLITNAHFFQGLREGTFAFVIGVLVFITTNSEMALGKFGLVNSAVAFVMYYLATRIIRKKHRKHAILIGGILLYASIFLILYDVTYTRLLMYAVAIAIAYPIILVPYASITYDVIGKAWKVRETRVEYIVVRELFLNAGRIVSILLFILAVTVFDEQKSVPILLMVIGAGHSTIYYFVRRVQIASIEEPISSRSSKNRKLMEGEGGSSI